MLRRGRIDTVIFSNHWASTVPVDVPLKDEISAARKAVEYHAILLYDNPLAENLTIAERDRFVREQLRSYEELLDCYGLIKTTMLFKKIASSFLESFLVTDDGLLYIPDEDIIYTPMYRSAMTLFGRIVDVTGGDRDTIQFILSWLLFLSKIPLGRPDLSETAETAWIDRQVNPRPILASSDTLAALRRLVGWLVEIEPTGIGNHGPGSTSNGAKTVPTKNSDYRPTYQSIQLTRFHVDDVDYELGKQRPCVYVDVHKDIGSRRPITKEPVETQFAQQALKFDLYRSIDDDPDMPAGKFIRFSDQTPSQECAIRGSLEFPIGIKPSTIDLSSASDYLSVDLVTELFSGNLLHLLMSGRTPNCLVGNKTIELSMYGGMGSALTFPVQTIIFTACAVLATVMEDSYLTTGVSFDPDFTLSDYLDWNGFRPQYKKYERNIRVYGDDICIPDFAAQRLVSLLQSLGLVVNVRKSFIGRSPVRESCGIYALLGQDITPKRFRLLAKDGDIDAHTYETIRTFANEAFHMGWKNLNRALIRHVRDTPKHMSSSIVRRRIRRGKAYPDQRQEKPSLLFEEDRGRDDYIGFISTRSTKPSVLLSLHEQVYGHTTFIVETETTRDDSSEYYHLTVNYRQMEYTSRGSSSEAHGSIPSGVRLNKRNAVRTVSHRPTRSMVWGWAPR